MVSCGELRRVLLAAELEHCLGYPRGHTASLVLLGDQVDLSHVELQRVAMLQSAAPVLTLVTFVVSLSCSGFQTCFTTTGLCKPDLDGSFHV